MKIYYLLFVLLALPTLSQAKEVPVYRDNIEQWEKSMLAYVSDWRNFTGKTKQGKILEKYELILKK